MAWVLRDAPDVPSSAAMTLMGLANHADHEGCGAYPAQKTLGRYARKDERQVRRDLAALEALGLIRKGDQRLVAHFPADRRPAVWDLSLELRAAPEESGDGPLTGGRTRPPGRTRPVVQDPPDADVPPDVNGRIAGQNGGTYTSGGTYKTERGDVDVLQTVLEPSYKLKASAPRKRVAATKRATRIPDDFALTEEMRKWGMQRAPHINGELETEKFVNYWQAKSGQSATKIDWNRTWQNWILNAAERTPTGPRMPNGSLQPSHVAASPAARSLAEALASPPGYNGPPRFPEASIYE